jgi:hypothetical protein
MFIHDPGSVFYHPGSRIRVFPSRIPDPGSKRFWIPGPHQRIKVFLSQKKLFLGFPDHDFLPIPDPGSKGTGSRTPYPQHFIFNVTFLAGGSASKVEKGGRQTACIYTSVVRIPGDVDLSGAGGGIDGGGEGAAARGDKLPVSIRQWSPYLVMLMLVEPAVELMVAVRGRRPGETSCLYLYVSGPHTW